MITHDVVAGMVKLHLNGYVTYDELAMWAANKCHQTDYVEDISDDKSEAMFDLLCRLSNHNQDTKVLKPNELAAFINRLEVKEPSTQS
ncbi:MAG: hypothetical protein H0Z39_03165 [Peptococcaceae bacterium]|nr:hypothetical protein [Peptococcaceae bacterium]